MPLDLIAAMAFGLESVVAGELRELGYKSKILQNGRVLFRADELALCRGNLWLRTADRVLLRMGVFPATDFGQLFDGVAALPWEEWLPADAAFPVQGRSVKSQLSSVPACQKIAKKAIVERLRRAHRVQTLPESGPLFSVEVAIVDDQATLTIDTTGPGLNKRGYRKLVGEAQLKETLAAAMILLSGWQTEQPLVDPFCGTGTIPIEAAMLACRLAPGMHRTFAAQSWPSLPARLWQQARQECEDLARPDTRLDITGSDLSAEPLSLARYHAREASVSRHVTFLESDFRDLQHTDRYGHIVTNPPYGQRLGQRHEVEALYRSMPDVLGTLPTWSHGILTSYPRFEKLLGRRADRRRKLYNGQIECFYYQFDGPRPDAPQQLGAFAPPAKQAMPEQRPTALTRSPAEKAGPDQKLHEQCEQFAATLANRARHLRKWPAKRGIHAYRLYHRDVPEAPLVIDRYGDAFVVVEEPRPHERSPEQHSRWLSAMADTAASTLAVPREQLFLKPLGSRLPALHESSDPDRNVVLIEEANHRWRVNLADYSDTGLFLDHRALRALIAGLAPGKRVLDLFAYTGSLGIVAATAGAASVTSVELHAPHRRWIEANARLNNIDAQQLSIVADDALSFAAAHAPGDHYDLVIVNPPNASDRRNWSEPWTLERDSVPLLNYLSRLLPTGGNILFTTHHRRYQLKPELLPPSPSATSPVRPPPKTFHPNAPTAPGVWGGATALDRTPSNKNGRRCECHSAGR
jgi:23S rRNA (guanine2445-N2)-methyltransferase / 23S rRNA (guanine2069-N7)-methyltransferase